MRRRSQRRSTLTVRGGFFATRAGGTGLIILGTGVALLAHGDWLLGALLSVCGSAGVLLGIRKVSSP